MNLQKLNEFINREFSDLLPRQTRYRYYEDKKRNRYFWTTEPTIKDEKKRFVSGFYRYLKTNKQWILKKKVYHARRSKAKERANRLFRKSKNKEVEK